MDRIPPPKGALGKIALVVIKCHKVQYVDYNPYFPKSQDATFMRKSPAQKYFAACQMAHLVVLPDQHVQ